MTSATDRRSLIVAYLFLLGGLAPLAAFLAPTAIVPTLLACLVSWVGLTIALRISHRTAGQGFLLAVTAVLVIRNYAGLGLEARSYAVVTLLVLAAPFLVVPLTRTRAFPFLHIWCLFEGIYVYVSLFLAQPIVEHSSRYPLEIRTTGLRMISLFTFLLVGSALVTIRITGREAPSTSGPSDISLPTVDVSRAYALAIAAFVVLGLSAYVGLTDRIGQIDQLVRAVGFGGGLLLATLWLDGRLAMKHKLALVAGGSYVMLDGLGQGALYLGAAPGLLMLALCVGRRRSVPWVPLFFALIGLIALNLGKGEFRNDTVYSDRVTGSTSALGVNWIDRTVNSLTNTSDLQVENAANRFATSNLLGYVATWAPHRYAFVGYGVYTGLPSILLPRVIFPEKRSYDTTNDFGKKYEIISTSDNNTAVNTPLPVEAFIAGGFPIFIIVGLLCGVFLALLSRVFRGLDAVTLVVGAIAAQRVMSTVESGVQGFVMVLPFIVLLRPFITWACRTRSSGAALALREPAIK